ncbi:serine palmitoyltransferase component, variant 4 [Lathyrus oleraceus]|uniref:Serine palmitoyltransferase component, variant 4 n=1 Tax=Pisum sativum TaxID=3888 RepID=A0A9D4W190_PEA|nr:serine palmitoyltransferase component, variant 4 [Pisum sativum]
MMLTVVKGPICYEDIKDGSGKVLDRFRDAYFEIRFLEDGNEYVAAINEVKDWGFGHFLRKLFVTMHYQVASIDHVMFGKELEARYVTVFSINKEIRQVIRKLCSKPRFQSSIKINTPIPKHVPNKKVIILWDLDNKPPRGPPYDAALSLKTLAERFGDVVSISAYTKRHSFFNLPQWNTNQNPSPNSIPCRVCGHECKSIFDLKIHFKRVHLYQRKKLREKLKSIKLSRSKVWFVRRIHTYNEAL